MTSFSTWPIEVPQLVVGAAETCGRVECTETTHGPVTLLDAAMVLLNQVIQVPVDA